MDPQSVKLFQDFGGPSFTDATSASGAALQASAKQRRAQSVKLVWGSVPSLGARGGLNKTCGEVAVKTSTAPMAAHYAGEVVRLAAELRPLAQAVAAATVPTGTLWNNDKILDGLPAAFEQVRHESAARLSSAITAEYRAAQSAPEASRAQLGWVAAGVHYPSLAKNARVFMGLIRDAFPVVSVGVSSAAFDKGAAGDFAQFPQVGVALANAERLASGGADGLPAALLSAAPQSGELSFTERPLESVLTFLFSTERLRQLRTSPSIEPLTMLAAAGDDLITRSLYVFGAGLVADAGGSMLSNSFLPSWATRIGKVAETVGGFAVSVAMVGLLAGVVLLYVVPLLPFVYFFFALLGWVFSIAEALLAVPLWALAHLRIDGEGFAGAAASGGYFLLFELFLRPFLIVAACVVSYLGFWGGLWCLSTLFDMATSEAVASVLEQSEGASGLDAFVFTIIFALMAYGVAVAAFKLIDKIPNEIMRWMGAGVRPFMGGNDAPDLRGSMLAGGAAVAHVSSGLQAVVNKAKAGQANGFLERKAISEKAQAAALRQESHTPKNIGGGS